jgi:DNA polymerase-3 subunit epsilon
MPEGHRAQLIRRVDPGIPIPPLAALHQIEDGEVAICPSFEAIAPSLASFPRHCDLCGDDIKRFDLPFLLAEFARAGLQLRLDNCEVLDVVEIDSSRDPGDLEVLAIAAVLEVKMARFSSLSEKNRHP